MYFPPSHGNPEEQTNRDSVCSGIDNREQPSYHSTGELGTSAAHLLWEISSNFTVRLFLLVGTVLGAFGSTFFTSVHGWLSVGILVGGIIGFLAGFIAAMLVEGIKRFIHETIHPSKVPGLMTCTHCQRSIRVPEEFLGKKVTCPLCSKDFVALDQGGKEILQTATKSKGLRTKRSGS
jgi:hypothetical protein